MTEEKGMSAKRWAAECDEGHTLMARMGAWAFLRRRGTVEGVTAGEGAPGGSMATGRKEGLQGWPRARLSRMLAGM